VKSSQYIGSMERQTELLNEADVEALRVARHRKLYPAKCARQLARQLQAQLNYDRLVCRGVKTTDTLAGSDPVKQDSNTTELEAVRRDITALSATAVGLVEEMNALVHQENVADRVLKQLKSSLSTLSGPIKSSDTCHRVPD